MDTMYSNIDFDLFLNKQNKSIENQVNKYSTNIILTNCTDETVNNCNKRTLTKNSNSQFQNTNNNFSRDIGAPIIFKNTIESKNNLYNDDYIKDNKTNTYKNIEIDEIHITTENKNVRLKTTNKRQKNISFSNEQLWEINRVNQILHNKITNGVKPTYMRVNPSISLVKATSTINRERKNKDIVKENEVSF